MKRFFFRLCNALKPCAGLVRAPRLRLPLPVHEVHERTRASASGALVSRGSIAMSRFPMVTEDDIARRRDRILHYDFTSFK